MGYSEDTARLRSLEGNLDRVGDHELPTTEFSQVTAWFELSRAERFRRLSALDRVLFRRQFVLIAADNSSPARVDTLDEARSALADGIAASAGGRLVDGALAADIDAEDPLVGDACAEALIAWCARNDLPWLLRESGRTGGRHVIAIVTDHAAPVKEWTRLCRNLSRRFKTTVDDRTGKVLRLLTAPHRIGLPAPVLSCNIAPADVVDRHPLRRKAMVSRGRSTSTRATAAPACADNSRSAKEFGIACAMVRQGRTGSEVYAELVSLGGKVAAKPHRWFVRYVLLSALTTVAAEQGLTESAAWDMAQRDCAAECRRQGRTWWRGLWRRAQAAAEVDRPRRFRVGEPEPEERQSGAEPGDIAVLAQGLRDAVDGELHHLDPRRRRSVAIALSALCPALLEREGSMSVRDIALRGRIYPRTASVALQTAVNHGLLTVTSPYAGGAADCHAYGIGPAAASYISAARQASKHTSCSTPAPTGTADLSRLRRLTTAERRKWSLRCDVLAVLATGERLATSQHHAAKALRSLWFQRQWWTSLTPEQKVERIAARKRVLGKMHRQERRCWFNWLDQRAEIVRAADAIQRNPQAGRDAAAKVLLHAPLTLHRGMADPQWREGGTPAPTKQPDSDPQLTIAAA